MKVAAESDFETTIYKDLDREVIKVDFLKLERFVESERRLISARRQWIAPLTTLLTLVLTLTTATFRTILGFPPEFWQAFFSLAALGVAGWLLVSLSRAISSWREGSTSEQLKRWKDSMRVVQEKKVG